MAFDRDGPTKYSHTPRKVFDRAMDRVNAKRLRDREDHRADMETVLRKLKDLQNELTLIKSELEEVQLHVERHCAQLDTSRGDTEGLE